MKNIFAKLINNKSGFTLMEMLVSVALYSVAILAATSIFQAVANGQRDAIASQNIQESTRYALEMMSKEIRTAKVNPNDSSCGTANNKIYNQTPGDLTSIYFVNQDNECVTYTFDFSNKSIMVRRVVGGTNYGPVPLTPSGISINDLKFIIIDNSVGVNNIQAKVIVSIEVEYKTNKPEQKQTMRIQTTISSRHYE